MSAPAGRPILEALATVQANDSLSDFDLCSKSEHQVQLNSVPYPIIATHKIFPFDLTTCFHGVIFTCGMCYYSTKGANYEYD
jgi:hypothetical protein